MISYSSLNSEANLQLLFSLTGKKVLSSSDEGNSDSEESLSNDYPKGWGPSHRRKSSPPHHDPEAYHEGLEEEDIVRLQEAAENSVSLNSTSNTSL